MSDQLAQQVAHLQALVQTLSEQLGLAKSETAHEHERQKAYDARNDRHEKRLEREVAARERTADALEKLAEAVRFHR